MIEIPALCALNLNHIRNLLRQNLADFPAFRIVRHGKPHCPAHNLARHGLGMVAMHQFVTADTVIKAVPPLLYRWGKRLRRVWKHVGDPESGRCGNNRARAIGAVELPVPGQHIACMCDDTSLADLRPARTNGFIKLRRRGSRNRIGLHDLDGFPPVFRPPVFHHDLRSRQESEN
uniref:Uncharacterized protein n=1 Tax=Brucella abortus TaxID=235 RepID=Q93FY1_BRUAO|nr:unknown [Brucella abortus]